MDTGEPIPGQAPSKMPQKNETQPPKVIDFEQASNELDLTQFRVTRGNIVTALNVQKTLKEARATSKTLDEVDSYNQALRNCDEVIEKLRIELEVSTTPVIQRLWAGLAESNPGDNSRNQAYSKELLELLEVQGMPLKKDIKTYIKAIAGRVVAPVSQSVNRQLEALLEIFDETGINLNNPVILEFMQRNPPEVYFDSNVDLGRNNLTMCGANYPALKIEPDQKEGTGRRIFDAGERVIKVDRIPGNFGHGSIVEIRMWDIAQRHPWLAKRLLPPTRWGLIRVDHDDYDRLHVFVEYPKVTEFYSGNVNYYNIEEGADVAELTEGIVVDPDGSNIAEYEGRWVLSDYNNPEGAAVYGGEDYYRLLEECTSCVRSFRDSKISFNFEEREKQTEYKQQVFDLRSRIKNIRDKYSTFDYFKD